MKIIFIGGTHNRHLYYANAIHKTFGLSGIISETRENILPKPPSGIEKIDHDNFIKHFKNRDDAEKKFFGEQSAPDCKTISVKPEHLSGDESVQFIKEINPDVVLTFGCKIIKESLSSALPKHTINLHMGLSPRYRGTATLFWPFYFMEPTYAGSTFHYLTPETDAGDIIHQSTPELKKEDKIHDVACKAVIQSVTDMLVLLEIFKNNGGWKSRKQKSTGKNFIGLDFKPEHLRVIYNLFNDDIVARYLDGTLSSRKPKLIRQF
jgi:hypothetical protein